MSQQVLLFEDAGWRRLYPITLSRPAFDCRIGVSTLSRRLIAQLYRLDRKRVDFLCRSLLRPLVERNHPGHSVNHSAEGDIIFLNGRVVCLGQSLDDLITLVEKAVAVEDRGELVAARVTGSRSRVFTEDLLAALEAGEPAPLPADHTVAPAPRGVSLIRRPWELIAENKAVLEDDFGWIHLANEFSAPHLAPGAQLLERQRILCREGVSVAAGAILDATEGPIFLGENVRIEHNAVVLGPAAIGPDSVVKMGARLGGPLSIGPVCKVGGEIHDSIFQGYGNKQHDGFLGHAYLGAWVNLGAATNNSDLKNNYSSVRVWTPDGEVDTGETFVGIFVGDHSKTAIGTLLNTGTTMGFCCNVFGAGFPPKHIPSFSWGGSGGFVPYDLEKSIGLARRVMSRRRVDMEPADIVLFQTLHKEAQDA